jgi:hypothetical protein
MNHFFLPLLPALRHFIVFLLCHNTIQGRPWDPLWKHLLCWTSPNLPTAVHQAYSVFAAASPEIYPLTPSQTPSRDQQTDIKQCRRYCFCTFCNFWAKASHVWWFSSHINTVILDHLADCAFQLDRVSRDKGWYFTVRVGGKCL